MTIVSKPTVYMIVIRDNPISMYFRGRVERSWIDRGFDIEYFDAITPETIPDQKNQLKFGEKSGRRSRQFSETEKAVWYSHCALWNIARRKQSPIIVAEHDALLLRPIDPSLFKNIKIMGLCHSLLDNGVMGTTAGGAYYLTRSVAEEMYTEAHNMTIRYNSDSLIHKKIDLHGEWRTHYCEQIREDSIGTTIKHG